MPIPTIYLEMFDDTSGEEDAIRAMNVIIKEEEKE